MHNVREKVFLGGATFRLLLHRTSRLLCGSIAVGVMALAARTEAAGCIISGSTERKCASISYEATPMLMMTPEGDLGWGSLPGLDSWVWENWMASPLLKFRSDPPSGCSITIR